MLKDNFRGKTHTTKIIKKEIAFHMLSYIYQRKGRNPRRINEAFDTVAARNARYNKYLTSICRNQFKLWTDYRIVPVDMLVTEGDIHE